LTASEAITKVLNIASAEVGYLEKKSSSSLDDKTANAGKNNYTKYWRDIKPSYQGQPWCAAFVTWCMEKAFGKDNAAKLLKHYPYVYCPIMANLFTLYTKPQKGDIVIFYRGGTYAHTGLVETVNGNYITTIEGNTSGGSTIIANGGGVFRKTYNINNLPGTKFCRPDYESIESEELSMAQYDELKKAIETVSEENAELKKQIAELRIKNGYYNYIDGNMPDSYRPTIQKLVNAGFLQGNEKGELMLTTDMMRMLTILCRILEKKGII
jgi:hypothetical protein